MQFYDNENLLELRWEGQRGGRGHTRCSFDVNRRKVDAKKVQIFPLKEHQADVALSPKRSSEGGNDGGGGGV